MARHWALGLSAVLVALTVSRTAGGLELSLADRPLTVSGWAMVRQGIRVDEDTPDDRTLEQLWLSGKYAPAPPISLTLTVNGQNGGPTTGRTKAGMYSYRAVFQSVSPSVTFEEAFVDVSRDQWELRAGIQKFAWGKLDRVQPVDVLNVERFSDPFLLDEDERKIGVPAVQASYDLPRAAWVPEEARLTAVWIPQYFPYWFPRPGERWYPPAATPPTSFPVPPLNTSVPVGFHVVNSPPPSFQLDNCGYAARASALTAGVDYAAYYYHGFDNHPAFLLTAEASGAPAPQPPFVQDVTATTRLYPTFHHIDLWGLDAAYAWDRFTFRAEGAFVSGRPFPRDLQTLVSNPAQLAPAIADALRQIAAGQSPAAVRLPQSYQVRSAFDWGVGVDYAWSDYLFLLQLNQTDILNNDANLLIRNVDTVLSANVRGNFLHDDLTVQLIAVEGIESGYTLLMPRLDYRFWTHFDVRVGYLFIAGRSDSLIGQYKANDEAFLWLRYVL
ncbi:MAG: hypothetical protein U0802_03780 [Candidatus Binatia bacterium]